MIDYFKGIYGTNLLLRVHGSALYKGMLVGCLSTLIYLAIELLWNKRSRYRLPNYWNRRSRWLVAFALLDSSQLLNDDGDDDINNVNNGIEDDAAALASLIPDLEDPYGAGVLVSGVTFLIIFRANTGYQRYWEAVSSLHQCMGKWMDATMCAASFHLQCVHYDGARPHNFYECGELNRLNLTLDRRRTSGAATADFGGGGGVRVASTTTTTSVGMRRRSPRSTWKATNTTTTTTTTRLTSAYDCEKEHSGDGNVFVGSKVVDNTTAATTTTGGGSGGGGGGLSASLSWRRSAMLSSSTSSQPGSNDGGSRRGGGLQLQRSWRRSFNSSTMPLFGSSNSTPTPLILPNSVLDGEWNIIPPSPYTTSPDMFHRTELHSRYFPSSQYRHDANFAHRPPIIDPSLGEVQHQRYRQYEGSNGDSGDYNNSITNNPSKVSTATTTPPLFLQELAHLSSLACAVALSTLRNDMERGESPLGIYIPGSDWPEIDPDNLPKHVLHEFQPKYRIVALAMHWLGLDRLPRYRSKYNASRPLLILGGVSDAEITFLQRARGPHAKVELANSWLKEFIIRESLSGSFGNVNPSITSRVVQHLSDGMMGYHMARKIMYIPFPFPHAQLTTFYTVVMVFAIPFLMDQYVSVDGKSMLWVGCLLTFLTVTCLVGLHEVSRELENPFRNVPNDLPLCTLHAMYNEALVTMYSGFNPDSFWDPSLYRVALEALAAKRDYTRGNDHVNNLCGKSNSDNRCIGSTFDANKCRNGTTTTTAVATSMKSSTDKDSLVVQSEEKVERGIAPANGEPPLSSLTLADARLRMKKTVSFADESERIASSDDGVVMELRNVLAQQACMIKELGLLLDVEEDEN